ncbi:conjugal transfer protein TraG N-terminal domain-containing protein [Marinobacterium aestuariivivens]|uniref:Conjugal transfer protein TraG N-terminal domain-containing protein n=1 Tax=Marinobacterium aestuariivivens TaxID=1698799 RepID=A0ABW2A9X2_9GAMM
MSFEIFSVGDAAFLEQILMAVAMVTSMGSFEQMVSVGLLLGVIFIFVQSVFQGAKQINFQQILVGYLLYACLFIPTTTVLIEDSYTGEVRVVDNVPLGIGAAGGIISAVGYNITNLFEQGYGAIVPYVTETHFAESLKILNDARKRIASTPVYQAMNMAVGSDADVRKSWNNYIRECTLTAIDLEDRSLDDVMAGELPEALRFNSSLYGTRLYLGSAGGTDYTCSEAYPRLVDATNTALGSAPMSDAILTVLGIDNTYTGISGQGAITNSLGMLGITSTSGTKYLTAAVIEPIYYEAAQGRYADFQDMASATMINQAIQQRNTQWAAEQSMFMTIVRPMMTFFEGFVYAITPLMGFLIVLGSFGAGLAGRYFQTLLWIQLWMPVMSIINLYIHTAAGNEMSSIGSEISSIYALSTASDQLQHWVATGGMLAASTPLISLFVVTGSTFAFTSLAGRISGKDHIDEKVQSRDLVSNGPIMQNQASHEYNDVTGMAASGAAGLMGTISFGTGLSSMASSAHQRMSQSQQSFAQSLGSSFSSGRMDNQTYERAASLGRTHSATHGTTQGVVNERTNQILQNSSIGSQHSDAVKGIVSAVASGAISGEVGTSLLTQLAQSAMVSEGGSQSIPVDPEKGSPPGTKAQGTRSAAHQAKRTAAGSKTTGVGLKGNVGLSAGANKETADTRSTNNVNSAAISDALKFSQSEQSQVTNNLAQAISTGKKEAISESFGQTDTQSLTRSAQDVVSSSESYSTASSMNQQYGSMNNLRLRDVGSQVAGNDQAMRQLNDYWNTGGVSAETKSEAQRLYERYSSPSTEGGYGLDQRSALAAARIKALQNSNNHAGTSDEQYQRNFNAAVASVGLGMGLNTGQAGDYAVNKGIAPVNNGDLRQQAETNAQQVRQSVAPAKGIAVPTAGYPQYSDPTTTADTPAVISGEGAANNTAVRATANTWEQQTNAAAETEARRQLLNNGPAYSRMGAAEFYGGVENANDWVQRRMTQAENLGESVFSATSEGMTVANANFDERLEALKSDPTLRQEVVSAARMSDQELASSGLGGKILSGLSSAGRSIMGATAAGIELAKGEIRFNDLQGMKLDEKGMVYQAAMSHALETGGEAAVKKFEETYGTDFRKEFYEEAVSRGLTHEQAQVYAHSFDTLGNSSEREAAIQSLAATYAEKNQDGSIKRDQSGAPVLSQQNQEFVDHMINTVTESARSGSTMSGSYLAGIAHYNNMTGRGARGLTD